VRRASGTISQDTFLLTVPAPGAVALLAVAGLTAGRRRRA
jgi:MYXO-CTERM domain-containing protein